MINQIVAGVQANGDGQIITARAGRQGEAVISQLHGRYYEQCYRNLVFKGGVAGQVTTVGLATTYTGLCLTNPIGSGVNLGVLRVGFAFLVAFTAAASVGLMTGFNSSTAVTQTTPITPHPALVNGGGAGKGLLASSTTLPTAPVIDEILWTGLTGAITTVPQEGPGLYLIDSSVLLAPGGYCAIYTSTAAGTASMSASFAWEEVPI